MFKSMFVPFLLVAALLNGQETAPKKEESFEAVLIPVKTLSADSLNRLHRLLSVFGAKFALDDKLRTILVYAPKDVVAQMRRVIEQLDQPGSEAAIGRNIELTMSFLRCSTKPSTEARTLPPDLEAVAKQIRAATQYKDVQLWDVVPLHIQEGKETQQSLRLPTAILNPDLSGVNAIATGHIRLLAESVIRKDSGRYVRFERVNIQLKMPYMVKSQPPINNWQYVEVGLNTAGEFKDGQKTVLGKASGIDDDSAVFVVLAPKILD